MLIGQESLHQETVEKQRAQTSQPVKSADIVAQLRDMHPDAKCQLNFTTPIELLVATILMSQCAYTRVNIVTPELFERYQTAQDYLDAPRQELERIIRPTGFYRQKARYIQGVSLVLVNEYDGQLPTEMELLLKLPGVSRKTANILMSEAFGIQSGVVVDTHVIRVAQRLNLSNQRHPKQIELDLMRTIPQDEWRAISHMLTFHGQRVCRNRRPACARCTLQQLCPSAE